MAHKIPALTREEVLRLLEVTEDHDYQFHIMCLIGISHGCRVSELIGLRKSDFIESASGTYLRLVRLKGSLTTTQQLLDIERKKVVEYIADLKPEELLFQNNHEEFTRFRINYLCKRFGKMAGIPIHKCHPHAMFKHTAGMLLRLSGANIEDIADHLGHKSIQNSRVYMNNTAEEVHEVANKAFAFAAGE